MPISRAFRKYFPLASLCSSSPPLKALPLGFGELKYPSRNFKLFTLTLAHMKKKLIGSKNIEILNILAEHSELDNKELSATIGLSKGLTLVRVQNLWERGIIKSFAAVINFQLFGYSKLFLIRVESLILRKLLLNRKPPDDFRGLFLNKVIIYYCTIQSMYLSVKVAIFAYSSRTGFILSTAF